jgi:hypothetical protein
MFSRKKFRKSFGEKILEKKILEKFSRKILKKFTRINFQNLFDIFCGPILGPIGGPKVKLKDKGLGL